MIADPPVDGVTGDPTKAPNDFDNLGSPTSFDAAGDKIDLVGVGGFSDFGAVVANLAHDGAVDAILILAADGTITPHGVNVALLAASNFQFDEQPLLQDFADMIIGNGARLPLNGIIENTGVSGVVWANGANLAVHGDVSGNGTAIIDGSGTVDFAAASSTNVVFGAGDGGALKLEDSFHFSGTISGFDGDDAIDLTNVYSATVAIEYHENAQGTGGVFTVSDGTHAAQLSFMRHYSADNFDIVPDHVNGTLITLHHDLSV